jgi:hypothetical protein
MKSSDNCFRCVIQLAVPSKLLDHFELRVGHKLVETNDWGTTFEKDLLT